MLGMLLGRVARAGLVYLLNSSELYVTWFRCILRIFSISTWNCFNRPWTFNIETSNMAKSIRSKRRKKFLAIKRLKLKPKLDEKLRKIIAEKPGFINEIEEKTEDQDCEKLDDGPKQSSVDDRVDEMVCEEEQTDTTEVNETKISKKNAKVPLHLLSQRKVRKIQSKRKNKNKFKW